MEVALMIYTDTSLGLVVVPSSLCLIARQPFPHSQAVADHSQPQE